MLQIDALLERRASQLSGGQRQRVAMGRALARNPAIFLFDEPLSNLDAKLRVEMRAEIKSLHQRLRNTIVYVTHDQVEAMTLGDRIAVMKDGLVQQFGTPAEIYERPANTYVAGFIGSPSMNFLPGTVEGRTLRLDGVDAAVGLPQAFAPRRVLAGLRPEHFQPCAQGTPGALRAGVEILEPTGADTFATVRLGPQATTVRYAPKLAPAVGDAAWLTVASDAISLFDADGGTRLAGTSAH
jgi:multiple sugar transport system ATP-binding protein